MEKKRNRITAVIIIISVLAMIFAGVTAVYAGKVLSAGPEIITVEKEKIVEKIVPEKVSVSGETIQHEIRSIGELCTSEYHFTHVETFDSRRYFFDSKVPVPGGRAEFIYSYEGEVKAGIDFRAIEVEKDEKEKTIIVKLPAAKIICSTVDPDSFTLYDEKSGIFNRYDVADVATSFADLLKSEETKAVDDGLLIRATDNALLLIENFLKAGYDISEYSLQVVVSETCDLLN